MSQLFARHFSKGIVLLNYLLVNIASIALIDILNALSASSKTLSNSSLGIDLRFDWSSSNNRSSPVIPACSSLSLTVKNKLLTVFSQQSENGPVTNTRSATVPDSFRRSKWLLGQFSQPLRRVRTRRMNVRSDSSPFRSSFANCASIGTALLPSTVKI
jgi:hypothetical protein